MCSSLVIQVEENVQFAGETRWLCRIIHKSTRWKFSVVGLSSYNSALYAQSDRDPAQATPVGLRGYLGINALIETGVGQFSKCWDIKKATFYYCRTKRPFIGAAFKNDGVETEADRFMWFSGASRADAFLIYSVR